MSNTVKMQHYVPRFYLRNFATDTSGSPPTVNCFNKPGGNQFQTSITNIAGENYFYDISEDADQEFELQLAAIEDEFSQAYETLLEHEDLNALDENDRSAIAYSIVIQELRTRENREVLEDLPMTDEMATYMDMLRNLNTDDGATRFQHGFMQNKTWNLAEIILDMKWGLLLNDPEDTGMPFWTSDHPIVRYNHLDHSPYGNLGLQNKGIQLYFPLSPTVSIAFYDPEMFDWLPSKLSVDHEHAKIQNSLQIRESTRHVIANTDDFSMIEDYLEAYPECADTDRDRVSVE